MVDPAPVQQGAQGKGSGLPHYQSVRVTHSVPFETKRNTGLGISLYPVDNLLLRIDFLSLVLTLEI